MATHNRCRGITRDAAQLLAKRNSMSASRFQSNNLLCKRFTRRSKRARRSPGVPLASIEFHSLFLRIDCVSRRITRYQAFHSIIPTFQSFARRLNGFSRVSLAAPGKSLLFKQFIRAFQRLTHSRGVSSACPSYPSHIRANGYVSPGGMRHHGFCLTRSYGSPGVMPHPSDASPEDMPHQELWVTRSYASTGLVAHQK